MNVFTVYHYLHFEKILTKIVSMSYFEKQNDEITGKINVQAVGPSTQGKADHRSKRSHGKH